MPKKKKDEVVEILTTIDQSLHRQNSVWRVFLLGLVRGFGTALGATVLVAVATSIVIQFTDFVEIQTFMSYFFNDALIE